MSEPTIVSYWIIRPDRGKDIPDYANLLTILQRSCDMLGLKHVVLTDSMTAKSKRWPNGIEARVYDLPASLMQATCEAQAKYLEDGPETDTLFVGADCIMRGLPSKFYQDGADLYVTFRGKDFRYPINLGAVLIRKNKPRVTRLFRKIAQRCQKYWCADQQAMIDLLQPMPFEPCVEERQGIMTAFVPMWPYNVLPVDVDEIDEPFDDIMMLHFRGKMPRKDQMVRWAERHMP